MDHLLAIYPTALKVEEVLKRETRPGCRFGRKVMTFPQLMDGLYRQSPGRRPVLTPLAARLAVEEATQQEGPNGRIPFSPSAGMLDHLVGLIREFKSAALEPEDLRQACGALNETDAARVSAIAEVFSRYQALLERRGVADRHDREREVLRGLERAEAGGQRPRLLDGVEQLLVAEIYDFTLLQFMIVASLIRLIGDACLTIQAEPHRVDSFRFPDLTWNRFVEDESIADQVLPVFVRREGRSGRLGFILQHLFNPADAEAPPPDDTIEIVEAPNRYGEIEEVARSIRRVLELPPPKRIEPRRIAVVARDLAPYAEYLESVFKRYRIPLSFHHSALPIASSPAALMLEVLRLPVGGYRRQGLGPLLDSHRLSIPAARHRLLLDKSGYIDGVTRPLDACLEDYCGRVASTLDSATDPERRRAIEAELSRLERARRDLHEFIAVFEPLEHPGSIAEHVQRLARVLRRLGFEPATAAVEAPAGGQSGAFRGWKILAELADAARLIGSERELSLEEFADLTEEVLGQASLEENTQEPGQTVQALSVLDARGLDFDLVFLLGLEDGGFPRYRSDDPILPDELRVALNRPLAAALQRRLGRTAPGVLRKILRTSVERNSEDRFLFFLALSMPESRLVMTYPRSDARGNPCLPSPFVDEVLRLLGHPERFSVRRVGTEGVVTQIHDCFDQDSFLNWAAKNSLLGSPAAAALAEPWRLRSIERRIEVERDRERYLALPTREDQASAESHPERLGLVNSYNGRVPASSRLRDYLIGPPGSPRPWSASRLDELGACGFKFFAGRVLNLAEDEELDYEPSALEIGGLVHDILCDLLTDSPDFRDRERALAQARKFLVDYRPKAQAREMVRDAALFDLKWQTIGRIVEETIERECAEYVERPFNQKPLLEHEFAFTLRGRPRLDGGESVDLVLRGQLDRLDLNRNKEGLIDRVRVVDYKTSRRTEKYDEMLKPENFGKTSFQLPVYLMASLEELKNDLARGAVLDAAYIVLRHREKLQEIDVEPHLVETDPESRAESARRGEPAIADNIIALADSAIRGEFDVDPRQCDEFCPFRRLCRYDKKPGA
jgi:ATP-dependent helicase/nuclease subunit B